ncbi:choline ABC transporter permease subunit [Sneathiella chungangensis]|uniref:Choline ABC transporter permease subunit n=1 Tax=Sneathiella chungangensis TaxID=1418234 RepID=A0A845MDV2_9PROT|nr:choline ABC transporter permease subunit [Sneathiella chungangensis]MZR21875.1 choline ABC transporter permease subunit [Sneathiella chungangensis]
MEWLTDHKIPLGNWIRDGVDFILDHCAWIFDSFSDGLAFLINGLIDLMLWCPPLLLVVIFAGLAYALHRSWKLSLLILLSLLLVINLGYWEETVRTLGLIIFATLSCVVVGVPIGIVAAHRPRVYTFLRPVLDLMQTIPTFVYLIPTMIMFGLGVVPGLISTVIFAIPAPIRLTYLGISSVPKTLIEAGDAFGATKQQILWKIELPHAAPTIMAGVTQCIMLCLSMVVIAAMVGAPGLGVPVLRALNTVNIAKGFEAGLAIVIIAILLDRVCKQPSQSEKK